MNKMSHLSITVLALILLAGCVANSPQKDQTDSKSNIVEDQNNSSDGSTAAEVVVTAIEGEDKGVEIELVDSGQTSLQAEDSLTSLTDTEQSSIAQPDHNYGNTGPREITIQKDNPNHFLLTLVKKDENHPFYGVGDADGFAINEIQGGEIVLVRGETYFFDVTSSPRHDAYISTNEMGWGAGIQEQGVEGNFIYEGTIRIVPDENTPDVLYYQCQNHKAMGSRIFIIDKDEKLSLTELRQQYGTVGGNVSRSATTYVSAEDVRQKISYANIVMMSKPAKRVAASDNEEAKAMLLGAKKMVADARSALEAGDDSKALAMVDESLRKMSEASKMVPSDKLIDEWRKRYEDLVKQLDDQQESYKKQYDRIVNKVGRSAVVTYDKEEVNKMQASADSLMQQNKLQQAIKLLEEATAIVTVAINKMLDSQTVVYELDISTPEGEYKYETDRYIGYLELVPVVLVEKQPSSGQQSLFDSFVNKAGGLYQKSEELANKGQYPDAIILIREATNQMRRALRLLGVQQ